MQPVLRLADLGDVDELVRFRAKVFPAGNLGDDGWLDATRARLTQGLTNGGLFVAVVEDQPRGRLLAFGVGMNMVHLPKPTNPTGCVGHIHSMHTDVPYRGRGFGRAVLDLLLATFWDTGTRLIELHASSLGYPLYQSAGFTPDTPTVMRLVLDARPASSPELPGTTTTPESGNECDAQPSGVPPTATSS